MLLKSYDALIPADTTTYLGDGVSTVESDVGIEFSSHHFSALTVNLSQPPGDGNYVIISLRKDGVDLTGFYFAGDDTFQAWVASAPDTCFVYENSTFSWNFYSSVGTPDLSMSWASVGGPGWPFVIPT